MSIASMTLDQAGLSPAGTAGKARLDGKIDGSLVTLASVGAGATHRFQLLYWPPTDTTANASLTRTGATTFTFSPTAAAYGPYLVELIVDEGLGTEVRQHRVFGVPSPVWGIVPPALNERGSSAASLILTGAALLQALEDTDRNVDPSEANSVEGWQRCLVQIVAALEAIGLGGGGGGRDTQFWADSSNDDGTYNSTPETLNTGAFVSQINRVNQWDAGSPCSTDLPAVGAGDHNKVVAYREAFLSTPTKSLAITAQGTTLIQIGDQTVTSSELRGSGSLHVFRYSEDMDKWRLVGGAQSLSASELRHVINGGGSNDAISTVALSPGLNSDVGTGWPFDQSYIAVLSAGEGYDQLGGLVPTDSSLPGFNPRKLLINGSDFPIVLKIVDGGSTNQFVAQTNSRNRGFYVLPPGGCVEILWEGTTWLLLFEDDAVRQARVAVTADDQATVNELLLVDVSGGDVAIATPDTPYDGERFALRRVDHSGNSVTLNGTGGVNVETPYGSTASYVDGPVSGDNALSAQWRWDDANTIWRLERWSPTLASNVPNDSGVSGTYVKDALDDVASAKLVLPPLDGQFDTNTGGILNDDTAYWLYLGRLSAPATIASIRFVLNTSGVGTSVGEVALASSPSGPTGASAVLTKIFAAAIAANLSAVTGLVTEVLSQVVPAGTHLWVGIRTHMSVTQPVFFETVRSFGDGRCLKTAGSGALTGAGPWTGTVVGVFTGTEVPAVEACLF
ncbi:MAG: hypothetical protein L3J73_02755 [Thermoplasmata archaeon]|nr:hypothetical protein [Thermoplasmata archaeon]